MRFKEFDKKMREYEAGFDQIVPENCFVVARLDGRAFTKLTKKTLDFEAPFDERFKNAMLETTKATMNAGFDISYAYTQSDEISLLFETQENTFGRKSRKIISTLAAEASVAISRVLGTNATMDCRIIPLPDITSVCDYFIWRQEDATRNALNGWVYWTLRKEGKTARKATSIMAERDMAFKVQLLTEHGIAFNELPLWQKYGCGLFYKEYEKEGWNPKKEEKVVAKRRKIFVEDSLPTGNEYRKYIREFAEK